MDKLSSRMRHAREDARETCEETLQDFQIKRADLMHKLEELKGVGGDAWQELKSGVDKASSAVREAYDKVKSSLHRAISELRGITD